MKKPEALQRRSPKQARARATVDSILEAAIQILQRAGAEGLNTNSVAERAGVSVGTLYQYFPDKEAILLAVARRELERPDTGFASLQKSLMEALIRAVEGLLGKSAAARAGRAARRTALKDTHDAAKRMERRVLDWFAPPVPVGRLVPVGTRR